LTDVAFITLGCKTNHYDTDVMAQACAKAGLEVVPPSSQADAYVINTCAVTRAADARGRNIIRRVIRNNPDAIVIVCGCSSEVDADRYRNIEGVDYVLGVRAAEELMKIVMCHREEPPSTSLRAGSGRRGDHMGLLRYTRNDISAHQPRARAFLKIQDGCNNRCAYCIVPHARGESRSVKPADVQNDVKKLLKAGHREIILTGVHIGQYGKDLTPQISAAGLIQKLLDETDNCRFRISSLDPDEMGDEMIKVLGHPGVCRHVHLSLQSGSDEVLEMMGRRSGMNDYEKLIQRLAVQVPGIAIGADIITGFPGETEGLFEQTVKFVERMPFAYLHVFPYSPRPMTRAATMSDQVPVPVRTQRAKRLMEISEKKRAVFYEGQLGKKAGVVIVSKRADREGRFKGISDNYLPLMIPGKGLKYREVYNVTITKFDKGNIYGTIEG